MTAAVNPYQSDPRAFSDEELKALADELVEAYRQWGNDDEYWLDDDAERRYYELGAEINRRFVLAHPDWKPPEPSELTKAMFGALKTHFPFAKQIQGNFAAEFNKIGDIVICPTPARFRA